MCDQDTAVRVRIRLGRVSRRDHGSAARVAGRRLREPALGLGPRRSRTRRRPVACSRVVAAAPYSRREARLPARVAVRLVRADADHAARAIGVARAVAKHAARSVVVRRHFLSGAAAQGLRERYHVGRCGLGEEHEQPEGPGRPHFPRIGPSAPECPAFLGIPSGVGAAGSRTSARARVLPEDDP
jgi:hypothetical protein